MDVLNIIVKIISQPAVVLAIVAALGLILVKKSMSEVIVGTFKTIIGFLMLNAGASIVIGALTPFSQVFTEAFNLTGFVAEDNAIAAAVQSVLGFETSMIMTLSFVINLLIARFTKFKYIFLTGHMMFSFAATMAIVLDQLGLNGWSAILLGSLIQGVCQVLFPALAQPFMKKLTGQDNIALGFWGSTACWASGWIGGKLGNKEKSAEDIKVPEKFSFLKDMSILMSIVMVVVFLVVFIYAGPSIVGQYSNGLNYLQFGVHNALMFVVGILVLLQGVRMFLGELIPAFKGISTKLIPGAIPALDIPIIYAYGPVSTTLGFIFAILGALVATMISTKLSAVILPSVIGVFFMGGAAGVFGNNMGGKRGAIIAGFLLGFVFSILPVICYNLIDLSVYGIQGLWFASTDAIIVLVIMKLIGSIFGL